MDYGHVQFIQMNIRTMNTLPAVWLNCFNLISRIILVVLSFNKSTSCRISLVGSSWLIPDQKVLAALFRSSRMWRWHTKLNLARVLVRLFRPDTNIMQIISLAITHILAQSNDVVSLIKLHSASRWITARKLRIAHLPGERNFPECPCHYLRSTQSCRCLTNALLSQRPPFTLVCCSSRFSRYFCCLVRVTSYYMFLLFIRHFVSDFNVGNRVYDYALNV